MMSMKKASKAIASLVVLLSFAGSIPTTSFATDDKPPVSTTSRPNFLFIVTDDQSWIHTSYAGTKAIQTPNFDRIAREGIYFEHAYASAPTCTASRSAILAGQHFWRLGSAGLLWGEFSPTLVNYQAILAEHGYKIGYTGKGWGPGRGWGTDRTPVLNENPAGPGFNAAKKSKDPNLSPYDFAENLRLFLAGRKPGQPFSYWMAPLEPHRPYHYNLGRDSGEVAMDKIVVPPFLPDNEEVRGDLADYLYEIQWFDRELGLAMQVLSDQGELDNTVIVYTSDNGMPFARSKSNNYEYGTREPLAVRWGSQIKHHQDINDFISLTDVAPTFLELAGIPIPPEMTGKSFKQQLLTNKSGWIDRLFGRSVWIDKERNFAFSGFERHIEDARLEHRCYPSRAIHTETYLYIKNFTPERWPAGRPPSFADIDDGSPSKVNLIALNQQYEEQLQKQNGNKRSFDEQFELKTPDEKIDLDAEPNYAIVLAGGKRPLEELYDVQKDPGQLYNLATNPAYDSIKEKLATQLADEMKNTNDPWATGEGAVFDSYKYYAPAQDHD